MRCTPGVVGRPQLASQEDILVGEHQTLPLVQVIHDIHVEAACAKACPYLMSTSCSDKAPQHFACCDAHAQVR